MQNETEEVLKDAWYDTGDIVRLDEEGFLWIEGRLSRFSKIGGEMVPHGNVEEALNELTGRTDQVFAVTGVPDDKKGERLVVIHTASEELLDQVLKKLPDAPIPNLWKPKPGGNPPWRRPDSGSRFQLSPETLRPNNRSL